MRRIAALFYNNPDQYPPIVNSARLMARAGIRVDILCRGDKADWGVAYPPGVRLRRIYPRWRGSVLSYLDFLRQVWRQSGREVDLFVGHDAHGFAAARILSLLLGKPLVYHCHDFAASARKLPAGSRMVKLLEQALARTADLVVVPDAGRGAVIQRSLGLKEAPLVAANAPLRDSAVGDWGSLRCALAEVGRSYERTVLRQGRIGQGHGIEVTIRSIPHWASREWGFVLMGVGEPAYVEGLRALARALGVERQVTILPPVGYDDVARYTAGANIGHALYEPIHVNNLYITTASNKLMEYMAAGIPALVSEEPRQAAFAREYGCAAPAGLSPESIAGVVNRLMLDDAQRREMGLAGRRAFETVFCYERQFAPALAAMEALG